MATVGAGSRRVRPSAGLLGELVGRWADTRPSRLVPLNEATADLIVRTYLGPLLPVRIDRLRPADVDAFYAAPCARS